MEALEQELMFPSMDVTPQDDAESAQERRVSDGSREKTASEAAVELAVRQHLSTRRIGGEAADPANKAWWTALASAARIHLSVKLQGRPTGPSEWEASLREVAPEQVDLFYALQDLIPKLVSDLGETDAHREWQKSCGEAGMLCFAGAGSGVTRWLFWRVLQ